MKKILILLLNLPLISSLSFGQLGPISWQGSYSNPVTITGDLRTDINFSSVLSASPVHDLTCLVTNKYSGPTVMEIPDIRNFSSDKRSGDENGAFPRGTILANLGVGVGDLYWSNGYGSVLGVSPTLDIDVAVTDKLGIGNIGVGGTIAYSSTTLNYGYGNSVKFTGVLLGLRGSYHFILSSDKLKAKFDPYAGVLLGYIISSGPNNPDLYGIGTKASAFQPGIFAGAHYYFVRHFGVFAELGYNGFSIFTFGIVLKTK